MIAQHIMAWCRVKGPGVLKDNLAVGAIVLLTIVTLPFLAILLITLRALMGAAVVVALVLGLAAYAVSPAFREWLKAYTDSLMKYKGLRLATDLTFHPCHSWARIEGEVAVGVDDVVQAALGPVDDVELPPDGLRVAQGERLFRLRHGNRTVDVPSPVSGTVLGVNADLRCHPELINDEPFEHGWAVRLKSDDPRADRKSLLHGRSARDWFRTSTDRIVGMLPDPIGAPTAEGIPVAEFHRLIDDAAWRQLSETMFSTPPSTCGARN
jgi:glycine cleavage system H protein